MCWRKNSEAPEGTSTWVIVVERSCLSAVGKGRRGTTRPLTAAQRLSSKGSAVQPDGAEPANTRGGPWRTETKGESRGAATAGEDDTRGSSGCTAGASAAMDPCPQTPSAHNPSPAAAQVEGAARIRRARPRRTNIGTVADDCTRDPASPGSETTSRPASSRPASSRQTRQTSWRQTSRHWQEQRWPSS